MRVVSVDMTGLVVSGSSINLVHSSIEELNTSSLSPEVDCDFDCDCD